MRVELRFQRVLVFLAVRPTTCRVGCEQNLWASGARSLDWNVADPFRHADEWLLHQNIVAQV
jgi:hypothetical protein